MMQGLAATDQSRPRFLLARFMVILAVAVAMIGSSAPTPIYGLYQARLHVNHVWLTAIYGAYSLGTVFALFVLGRISDRIPDRRVLLIAALVATTVGALIMAIAQSVPTLLIGRFFAGMGTGCVMGPATAALIELDPARDRIRAAIIATVAVTAGITSGILLTACMLEADLAPAKGPFIVLATLAVMVMIALRIAPWPQTEIAPATQHPDGGGRAKANVWELVQEAGIPFGIACAGMATAWMAGGSFLALGAIFARQLAGIRNPALAALTVAVFQIVAGCIQLGGRNQSPVRLLVGGMGLMILGLALATLAAATGSAAIFCAGALFTGLGYGSGFSGAAAIGGRSAPARGRATIVSFTYIAGYLGNLGPVMILGAVADHFGLFGAIATLAVAGTVCGILLSLAAIAVSRRQADW